MGSRTIGYVGIYSEVHLYINLAVFSATLNSSQIANDPITMGILVTLSEHTRELGRIVLHPNDF